MKSEFTGWQFVPGEAKLSQRPHRFDPFLRRSANPLIIQRLGSSSANNSATDLFAPRRFKHASIITCQPLMAPREILIVCAQLTSPSIPASGWIIDLSWPGLRGQLLFAHGFFFEGFGSRNCRRS
ncbi:MAG: hypothetical protein DMF76_17565 [Acidobacteria bacterium]|nr:MAG: hypothetical protein DMF76_17565 [Acidobacteriota bacterium]